MASITIIKGDNTTWNNVQGLTINLQTDYNLSERFGAEFTLCGITKKFDSIENNTLYPVFSSKDTASFVVGDTFATFKLLEKITDGENHWVDSRIKTIKSDIPVTIVAGQFNTDNTIISSQDSVISIIRGDDTDWNGDNTFTLNLVSELDLSQFKARFILGHIIKEFDHIVDNRVQPILSHQDTEKLNLGPIWGILQLIDAEGNIRTVASGIKFLVKRGVFGEQAVSSMVNVTINVPEYTPQEINISVGTGVQER